MLGQALVASTLYDIHYTTWFWLALSANVLAALFVAAEWLWVSRKRLFGMPTEAPA